MNRLVLRQADMVVRPDVGRFHWANFGAADRIRVAGEESMRDALPRLRRLLKEREGVGYRARRLLRRLFTRRT